MPMQPQTFSAWKQQDRNMVGLTVCDPNPQPHTKITRSSIHFDVHTARKWVQFTVLQNYAGSNRTARTYATLDPEAARRLYEVLREVFEPTQEVK